MPDASGATEPDSPRPAPGWFAKTLGGIGLIALSRHMAKEQAGDDIPGVTIPNPRAQKIAECASALIRAGQSDEDVLAEVIEMARGKTRDLKIAATLIRQDGVWIEEVEPNRVVRILDAAATNRPIASPRREHASRFVPIARFNALDPDIAYEELKSLVPELDEVESRYSTAFQGVGENGDNLDAMFPSWLDTRKSLQDLLGPSSGSEDVIVQSIAALNLAMWQIPERGGQAAT